MVPLIVALAFAAAAEPTAADGAPATGTIPFASLAPRGWDLYVTEVETGATRRLTDHPALDFNAAVAPDGRTIVFASERDGIAQLYELELDVEGATPNRLTDAFGLNDHPSFAPDGRKLAFCSTREPSDEPGRAWNAVYVMDADGSNVTRITPEGRADYSPCWSPAGDRIAVASGSGASGGTALYVMAPDGSDRRRVIDNAGWPAFSADGQSLYFHSRRDGGWGLWRVDLDGSNLERITPEDVTAYTPRVSADGRWLVAAVVHQSRRQIARIDLETRELTIVTDEATDHWNPAIAPDGRFVVYHKQASDYATPNVERWAAPPETKLTLLRMAGSFPVFSPDYQRIALTGGSFARIDVMNLDGSDRQTIFTGEHRAVFSLAWKGDRIAFARGSVFQGAEGHVDLYTIQPDGSDLKPLTEATGNDGFPAFAPDGEQLVFRSGRDGHKNLYIMNRDGSDVRRLTAGAWTDTMPDWSPTGDWIVFASDRDGAFEIWMVRPDGSDLRKLIGGGRRNNHPKFSPDGQWVVFTSQRAGYSAEEIALPSQPQPYGSLFAVRVDGSDLTRLTHNGFEEGTPSWGPVLRIEPSDGDHAHAESEY